MERLRLGYSYLYINDSCEIDKTTECGTTVDKKRYDLGNYYLLSEWEQATKDAAELRKIFKQRTK